MPSSSAKACFFQSRQTMSQCHNAGWGYGLTDRIPASVQPRPRLASTPTKYYVTCLATIQSGSVALRMPGSFEESPRPRCYRLPSSTDVNHRSDHVGGGVGQQPHRSEEHTSELQS